MNQRWAAVAAGIAGAALLGTATAGDSAAPRTPNLPDLDPRLLSVPDPRGAARGLEFSDLVRADLARDEKDWIVQTEFAREIVDGMFTVIEIEWDCDGRRSDTEIWTLAAVGSRFRPNAYVPRDGERSPIDLARASWSSAFDERLAVPLNGPRRTRTHWDELAVPSVGGARFEFRVPSDLIDRHGARGATSPPGFRLTARTTCSEHPVVFDYDAGDLGRDIKVDGTVTDWSGGPYAEDGRGELHPAVPHLDLAAVWCEHGSDRLFVRVDFAAPGFGTISTGNGDVFVSDSLHVSIEPLGIAYMDPVEFEIPATSAAGEVTDSASRTGSDPRARVRARYVCGTGTVELSVPRKPEQTRLRVAVWTDAMRSDVLTGNWQQLPSKEAR